MESHTKAALPSADLRDLVKAGPYPGYVDPVLVQYICDAYAEMYSVLCTVRSDDNRDGLSQQTALRVNKAIRIAEGEEADIREQAQEAANKNNMCARLCIMGQRVSFFMGAINPGLHVFETIHPEIKNTP